MRFRPGTGETTPGGWIIAAGYFAASWFCRGTGRQELRLKQMGFDCLRPRYWLFISYCLLVLGVNRMLGLENWLTNLGRQMAAQAGWYGRRGPVQIGLISMICTVGLAALLGGLAYGRGQLSRYAVAWIGTTGLIGLTAIRAVSLHALDLFLSHRWGFISVNLMCELGGLSAIALGARGAGWLHFTNELMPVSSHMAALRFKTPHRSGLAPILSGYRETEPRKRQEREGRREGDQL